jgi:hypothetical protein
MRAEHFVFWLCLALCVLLAALPRLDALTILGPAGLKGTRVNTPRILPHVYGFTPVQGTFSCLSRAIKFRSALFRRQALNSVCKVREYEET